MGRKGWSAGVAPASVDDSRVSSGRKTVLWENTKLSSVGFPFRSGRYYGAQSHVFYTVAYCAGPSSSLRLSVRPSRVDGHSIAHENTMNAIAALPSLTVAPRARVTRKVAAKARAVRPDRAGRGDHRTANRECRESLLSGSRVSGLLAAPSDAPRHRDFSRRPRDSHGTIPTPVITKRRPASPSWPTSRCVSVPRSTPGPNRARQRGSLGATISFSICVSSQVLLFVFQRRLR